ncbi:MAG: hypothetical protein ACRDZX_16270 [Acidimicrobiales bacterium]
MQEQVSRQQYVGIDLHRRRSVVVRMDETGKVPGKSQVLNGPVEFALAMAEAGEGTARSGAWEKRRLEQRFGRSQARARRSTWPPYAARPMNRMCPPGCGRNSPCT